MENNKKRNICAVDTSRSNFGHNESTHQFTRNQLSHEQGGHLLLWRGLKSSIYRDDTLDKKALFKKYIDCNFPASLAYPLINSNIFLKSLSVSIYFIKNFFFLKKDKKADFVTMIQHANERSAFDEYLIYKNNVSQIKKNFLGVFRLLPTNLNLAKFLTLRRIFNRLLRKYDLYIVLRVAEFMAFYCRFYTLLKEEQLKGILMFTDTNPNGIALMFIAQRLNTPLYFISRAEAFEPIPPFKCTAAFLLGLHSLRTYEKCGCQFEKVFFRGHQDSFREFQPIGDNRELTIGFFLGKSATLKNVSLLLKAASQNFTIRKILIRKHPNRSFNTRIDKNNAIPNDLIRLQSTTLSEDIEKCDLILAGNSATQLEALLMGKAVMFCKEIEEGDFDIYQYVKDGLIMCWEPKLTLKKINDFYSCDQHIKIKNRTDLSMTLSESISIFNHYVFDK